MRRRTGGPAAAALASLALILTACGGGGAEPEPGASQPAGQAGGEIVVAGCTPENPLIPGATSETCGGDIIDAMTSKLVAVQHRKRRAGERHRGVHRDKRQQALHGQAEALQVPRRHRRQGQELRRRLELHRLRPQRPSRQLLLRAVRRVTPTCNAPTPTARKSPRPRPCPA